MTSYYRHQKKYLQNNVIFYRGNECLLLIVKKLQFTYIYIINCHYFSINFKYFKNNMNLNDDETNYIINLKLMKMTGFYHLISPRAPKYYGFNVYKVAAAIEVMTGVFSIIMLFLSSYYYLDDTNELMSHFMLVVAIFFSTLKIFWVSKNSETIWNNIDMTCINFLSYTGHKKEILKKARAKSISTTILFVILWSSVTVAWSISPFFIKGVNLNVKFKDKIRRFRYNSLNYVYPISEEFYNGHFLYFYVVEMLQVVFWGHGTVAYDTFVISICITIAFQLKTIAASYISLNARKGKFYSN